MPFIPKAHGFESDHEIGNNIGTRLLLASSNVRQPKSNTYSKCPVVEEDFFVNPLHQQQQQKNIRKVVTQNVSKVDHKKPVHIDLCDCLPIKSIIFDYNREPIGIKENKRIFYSLVGALSSPFLRPILIDGIGLMKVYWESCSDDDGGKSTTRCFPFTAIVRCLFYWISRGHHTRLCFPYNYSPITDCEFQASNENIKALKQLEALGIAEFFEDEQNHKWFTNNQNSTRGCLITSFEHFLNGMSNNLRLDYDYMTYLNVKMCPPRVFQPNFGSQADIVFFNSFNAGHERHELVLDTALDNDIQNDEQFRQFEPYQLSFINQAKQLRVLYDMLPGDSRMREAKVMIELLNRLAPFL